MSAPTLLEGEDPTAVATLPGGFTALRTRAVYGVPPDVMAAMPALELIVSLGPGLDKIDLAEVARRGIAVADTADELREDVAVDPRLRALDDVLLSPHAVSLTVQARQALIGRLVASTRAVFRGHPVSRRSGRLPARVRPGDRFGAAVTSLLISRSLPID